VRLGPSLWRSAAGKRTSEVAPLAFCGSCAVPGVSRGEAFPSVSCTRVCIPFCAANADQHQLFTLVRSLRPRCRCQPHRRQADGAGAPCPTFRRSCAVAGTQRTVRPPVRDLRPSGTNGAQRSGDGSALLPRSSRSTTARHKGEVPRFLKKNKSDRHLGGAGHLTPLRYLLYHQVIGQLYRYGRKIRYCATAPKCTVLVSPATTVTSKMLSVVGQ